MVATEFSRAEVIERFDLPNRLAVQAPPEVPDHPVVIFGVFARHGCCTFHGGHGFTIGIEGPAPAVDSRRTHQVVVIERGWGPEVAGVGLKTIRSFSSLPLEQTGSMWCTFDATASGRLCNNISLNPNKG